MDVVIVNTGICLKHFCIKFDELLGGFEEYSDTLLFWMWVNVNTGICLKHFCIKFVEFILVLTLSNLFWC